MTSPFVKYLLRDLDLSFKDSDYCDVLIEVGENDKKEILRSFGQNLMQRIV
jgi:hypothetical protein